LLQWGRDQLIADRDLAIHRFTEVQIPISRAEEKKGVTTGAQNPFRSITTLHTNYFQQHNRISTPAPKFHTLHSEQESPE
jgi:hypothetical protein